MERTIADRRIGSALKRYVSTLDPRDYLKAIDWPTLRAALTKQKKGGFVGDTKRLRELAEDVLNLKPDFCGGNWRTHYDYEKAANPQAILALIDELEKTERENEILKSKASQFESTLKETMRVRDAEIERLKRYTQHRIDCIRRVGVFEYSNDCDCGLAAIGKGSDIDKLREHFGYSEEDN